MSSHNKEIMQLMNSDGKKASDMTSALKKIGDGDMQKGINFMASYFMDIGIDIGERNGWIKGSTSTLGITILIGGGVYLMYRYKKYKTIKELEAKGEKICEALKESTNSD